MTLAKRIHKKGRNLTKSLHKKGETLKKLGDSQDNVRVCGTNVKEKRIFAFCLQVHVKVNILPFRQRRVFRFAHTTLIISIRFFLAFCLLTCAYVLCLPLRTLAHCCKTTMCRLFQAVLGIVILILFFTYK